MKGFTIIATAAALLALGVEALADSQETKDARVIGGPPAPARYLFEVEFTAIDGENIAPREMLTLEPGTYTFTARIPARYTRSAIEQRRRSRSELVDFELTLEPGKAYSVQGKWNRNDRQKPYELVHGEIH